MTNDKSIAMTCQTQWHIVMTRNVLTTSQMSLLGEFSRYQCVPAGTDGLVVLLHAQGERSYRIVGAWKIAQRCGITFDVPFLDSVGIATGDTPDIERLVQEGHKTWVDIVVKTRKCLHLPVTR